MKAREPNADADDLEAAVLAVATGEWDVVRLASWIRSNVAAAESR